MTYDNKVLFKINNKPQIKINALLFNFFILINVIYNRKRITLLALIESY